MLLDNSNIQMLLNQLMSNNLLDGSLNITNMQDNTASRTSVNGIEINQSKNGDHLDYRTNVESLSYEKLDFIQNMHLSNIENAYEHIQPSHSSDCLDSDTDSSENIETKKRGKIILKYIDDPQKRCKSKHKRKKGLLKKVILQFDC